MRRVLPAVLAYAANTVARYPRILLFLLAASLTLGLQYWTGGATIYRSELVALRDTLHSAIVRNELPPGRTWTALGSNGVNTRVGVVYLAEAIHRTTGTAVYLVYKTIDTVALLVGMLLFFVFISQWVSRAYALMALLFLAAVAPLTYVLHFFHPWDRPALVAWLACLILLRAQRLVVLAVLLPFAVAIKLDIAVFPLLYFLAYARAETWRVVSLRTVAMLAVTFATYFVLQTAHPSGIESQRTLAEQVAKNFRDFAAIPLFYPPLLAMGLPFLLGLVGWSFADRFARACWVFALVLSVPLFLLSNFQEVRAEMPVFVLLMPCAILGARAVLEGARGPAKSTAPELS